MSLGSQTFCKLCLLSVVTALRLQAPFNPAQAEYDETEYLFGPEKKNDIVPRVLPVYKGQYTEPQGLDEFLNQPLFSKMDPMPQVSSSITRADMINPSVLLLYYHKTGCAFTSGVLGQLQKLTPAIRNFWNASEAGKKYEAGGRFRSFWHGELGIQPGRWARVNNPSSHLQLPDFQWGLRTVHFYRSPVSKLLSGYRYHMSPVTAENWEGLNATCLHCNEDEAKVLFETCNYKCNFFSLLQDVNETRGIQFEALQSRQELEHSILNLQKWANHPEVLHLSMDHLRTNFDDTMKCMLGFLNMPTESNLEALRHLDIKRYPNVHATRGHFDNSALKTYLDNHPHWGPQFKEVQQLENDIFARQKNMYGCPMPATR